MKVRLGTVDSTNTFIEMRVGTGKTSKVVIMFPIVFSLLAVILHYVELKVGYSVLRIEVMLTEANPISSAVAGDESADCKLGPAGGRVTDTPSGDRNQLYSLVPSCTHTRHT